MPLVATYMVTEPGDPITAYLGGNDQTIPLIELGPRLTIHVHCLLSPAEQVDWLLDLATKAERLATDVALRHRVPVTPVAPAGAAGESVRA